MQKLFWEKIQNKTCSELTELWFAFSKMDMDALDLVAKLKR